MGAVKSAPLHETFCVFPPAGGDQVGEAVGTPGAWTRILVRAPPTMAFGTIRRVVLEKKKKFKKHQTIQPQKKAAGDSSPNRKSADVCVFRPER